MAVPARKPLVAHEGPNALAAPLQPLTPLQQLAARMYAEGHPRQRIARYLEEQLLSTEQAKRPEDQRRLFARRKLKRWEARKEFRDAVWRYTQQYADMSSPSVVAAMVKAAQRGRVDAARLTLEISGRHDPKGDAQPTQVVIAISGVPRPLRALGEGEDVIEGTAVEVG